MTDRIEKAYCLKEEELAVLLSIKSVRQLYGFRMEIGADMSREQLHRILFELARKKILSLSGNQIQIHDGVEAVLDDMMKAENVLILTGRAEYPECCIYVGKNLVFVHLLGQSGKIYRIVSAEREEACLKMREYGWMVPGVIDKPKACWEDTQNHQQMQELARMLYAQGKERILQEEEVACCLMQYSLLQTKKIRQLLIVNGVLEDYLVLSDEEQDLVYLYSDEKSEELLGQLIGGGI